MGRLRLAIGVCASLVAGGTAVAAQAPDGTAVLRAAGVDVPRTGAEGAFNAGLTGPSPVPPGAFPTLIVGMGPVGPRARVRNAYAFGVLAGRSGRMVPLGELAGAGVAILQMIVADDRPTRIAGTRVAGWVFATPIDGRPAPPRPTGLVEAVVLMLNVQHPAEQGAAMEAVGLLGETAVVPTLTELHRAYRERNNREMAGRALEALVRIGLPQTEPLVRGLATDGWGDKDDAAGLAVAYARERYLADGSRARLEAARDHKTFGPIARAYLAELGQPRP
jgi:hypothetical protein